MSERLQCALCGREGHDIIWARPVLWTGEHRAAHGIAEPWGTVSRCPDFQGCRARVEAAGKPWPVKDAVTRPTMPASPVREEIPV